MTLRDAINGTKASDKEKAAMIEKMLKNSEEQSAKRRHDGGKLDEHDAMRAVHECLTKLHGKYDEGEIEKAKSKAAELLAPKQPVWADGLLEDHEFDSIITACLGMVGGKNRASSAAQAQPHHHLHTSLPYLHYRLI